MSQESQEKEPLHRAIEDATGKKLRFVCVGWVEEEKKPDGNRPMTVYLLGSSSFTEPLELLDAVIKGFEKSGPAPIFKTFLDGVLFHRLFPHTTGGSP